MKALNGTMELPHCDCETSWTGEQQRNVLLELSSKLIYIHEVSRSLPAYGVLKKQLLKNLRGFTEVNTEVKSILRILELIPKVLKIYSHKNINENIKAVSLQCLKDWAWTLFLQLPVCRFKWMKCVLKSQTSWPPDGALEQLQYWFSYQIKCLEALTGVQHLVQIESSSGGQNAQNVHIFGRADLIHFNPFDSHYLELTVD